MIADFDVSLDCKLGYLIVQLALYGFMIESPFDVKVKEAVGVFCHQSGTSEFSFDRVERKMIREWIHQEHLGGSSDEDDSLRIDFGDVDTRVQPSNIGSLPSKRGKGRPGRSHAFVKEQAVDTKLGPAILVDEFEGGWNCDYGDQ